MQQWLAQAPANIALIKYMGKDNPETNLPANPSLSDGVSRSYASIFPLTFVVTIPTTPTA